MTISVLMSTYHKEEPAYLDVALKSIWTDQTRHPEQIVLVKDGPLTPELDSIISQWKDIIANALTIIAKPNNQGLALALNDGIEACTGDLIARMDTDDIAMPDRLEKQEAYMISHPELDILGGALQEFNDEGTLHKVRMYPIGYQAIRSSIHKGTPVGHPTVMFRRSFFDAGYRYNNKYYICEDITLWFEAIKGGIVIDNMPDIVLQFRRNDSTMTRRNSKKAWSEFLAYVNGIYSLDGIFTYKYIYPAMRLVFRLMPQKIIKWIYNSNLRKYLFK